MTQTGACLLSRRLQGPKQAPVWHYTKCRTLNRHLFAFAQASAEAEEVYPGTRPNYPAPAGALFAFAQASAKAGKFILVPGQTSQPRQGPCLASLSCCALRMVSWCAKGDLGGAERDCCEAETR